jgi:hypothetical protein
VYHKRMVVVKTHKHKAFRDNAWRVEQFATVARAS